MPRGAAMPRLPLPIIIGRLFCFDMCVTVMSVSICIILCLAAYKSAYTMQCGVRVRYFNVHRSVYMLPVWAEWKDCTKPCGNGTQRREKYCGTVRCGELVGSCNLKPCDGTYNICCFFEL